MEQKMKIGGPCFLLVAEPGVDAKRAWEGSGQLDWFIDDPEVLGGRETLAVEKLGQRKLHGLSCLVVLCDDDRVRAVPMSALKEGGGQ